MARTSIALAAYNKKIATEITHKLEAAAADEAAGRLPNFGPSPQQQRLYGWINAEKGSAFLQARAGTGKTTTLVGGVRHMLGGTLADLAGVRSGTFHSFGFSALRQVAKDVKVDERAKRDRVLAEARVPEALADFAYRLQSLAKQAALGLLGSVDDEARWWAMVDHHDLASDLEDPALAREGIQCARRALKASNAMRRELIDFDDMIYLPIIHNVRVWQNDWVLVDEAQDTNPARRALARKMLRPGGRAIFVGDDRQAIYGFTGADADAIEVIQREFGCRVLPLTVTYRCPRVVVELAQTIVPDFEAHESAPEGVVRGIHEDDLVKEGLGPRDAVLCRKTAPLISLAYRFIKAGTACHVEGRAIGEGLLKLARRWKIKRVSVLRDRLTEYREREVAKLMAKGRETAAEALADRCETLLVLAEGCEDLDCVVRKIGEMFADDAPTLTLSTIHRSKGREWPRVYVLGARQFMPSPYARQAWQMVQEENLRYVAFTRAQAELVLVDARVP